MSNASSLGNEVVICDHFIRQMTSSFLVPPIGLDFITPDATDTYLVSACGPGFARGLLAILLLRDLAEISKKEVFTVTRFAVTF